MNQLLKSPGWFFSRQKKMAQPTTPLVLWHGAFCLSRLRRHLLEPTCAFTSHAYVCMCVYGLNRAWSGVAAAADKSDFKSFVIMVALAHGLAIVGLAMATDKISGGHFNPAVTLAAMLARKMQPRIGIMCGCCNITHSLARS
jgi:hypothetical protein